MLLLHLAASPALLQIPVLPSILPLPLASLPPSLVISIPCLQICFLGNTGQVSAMCFFAFSSTLAPSTWLSQPPRERPLHQYLSPTPQRAHSPAVAGALPVPLPC